VSSASAGTSHTLPRATDKPPRRTKKNRRKPRRLLSP